MTKDTYCMLRRSKIMKTKDTYCILQRSNILKRKVLTAHYSAVMLRGCSLHITLQWRCSTELPNYHYKDVNHYCQHTWTLTWLPGGGLPVDFTRQLLLADFTRQLLPEDFTRQLLPEDITWGFYLGWKTWEKPSSPEEKPVNAVEFQINSCYSFKTICCIIAV